MKKYIYIIATFVMFSWLQISFADSGTYELTVDGKTFDITYSLDGQVIAIEVDQESTSLLVGITDVNESIFEIGFSSEVLSATNGEFIVLVDGLETDYTTSYDDGDPTITFPIESGSEEVEIIGTSVIPEFPFGAIAVMGMVSAIVLFMSRSKFIFR
ncbi:MAG: hypothetical protein AB1608_04890 [Thermoproteota archaeon]